MNKYSKNKKLNSVLLEIERQLLELGIAEVERYRIEFSYKVDYNIVEYGNVLFYYEDVQNMYKFYGYKSMEKLSCQKIWEIYKRQVGYVTRRLLSEKGWY